MQIFPYFTDWGRVRASFNFKIRQEFLLDFYVSLSFYDDYDSRPPTAASKNDFGTTLALGWDL